MKKHNHKKLKISKQNKRYAITILVVLLLINVGLIMKEVLNERTTEENQVVSSFSNTPEISYRVYLKENAMYDEIIQPEDIGYFSTLIDHIEVTFNNKYQGGNGAEYKGDYTLIGEIIGWEGGTEEPTPAWTKQFVISPKKTFRSTDDELKLTQSSNINYNHFNAFVVQVGELTGYNASSTMQVTMKVNYTVTTADEELTGSLQPSLTIPLGESYFKIGRSGIEEIKNDITKTIEKPVPVDYIKIILFSTASLLCLILLILFSSSVEPMLTDIQKKQVRKMLKAHGNRLVAVYDNIVNETLSICSVHSMNDMIKISDEIERPIFYVYQNDISEIKEFFIIDREKAYLYQVSNCHESGKKKTDSEKTVVSTESGDGGITVTV